jgi:P27 family predicted phage terminase small subunit
VTRLSGPKPRTLKAVNEAPVPRQTGKPAAPSWLTVAQRRAFSQIVTDMVDARVGLASVDASLIVAMAIAVDLHRQACETLAHDGLFCPGRGGATIRHPAVIVCSQQAALLDRLAASLGLSPTERSRMRSTTPDTEGAANTPAEYFRRSPA